ncbi:MAG: type II toxin-antitoxin system RelE/ParE family toxin [Pseudomonadota bacterium]|nr:type II toxin-antitoxin system RelE/ParE family toxin [Pseudomonadota bacterium]
MLKLTLTNDARKTWCPLPAKQFKQVAVSMLSLLSDPYPHDSQSMKGSSMGERRVTVGEYRIVYAVAGDSIEIVVIGKRNDDDAYRRWKRKP